MYVISEINCHGGDRVLKALSPQTVDKIRGIAPDFVYSLSGRKRPDSPKNIDNMTILVVRSLDRILLLDPEAVHISGSYC